MAEAFSCPDCLDGMLLDSERCPTCGRRNQGQHRSRKALLANDVPAWVSRLKQKWESSALNDLVSLARRELRLPSEGYSLPSALSDAFEGRGARIFREEPNDYVAEFGLIVPHSINLGLGKAQCEGLLAKSLGLCGLLGVSRFGFAFMELEWLLLFNVRSEGFPQFYAVPSGSTELQDQARRAHQALTRAKVNYGGDRSLRELILEDQLRQVGHQPASVEDFELVAFVRTRRNTMWEKRRLDWNHIHLEGRTFDYPDQMRMAHKSALKRIEGR